jgi:hypothetical protein
MFTRRKLLQLCARSRLQESPSKPGGRGPRRTTPTMYCVPKVILSIPSSRHAMWRCRVRIAESCSLQRLRSSICGARQIPACNWAGPRLLLLELRKVTKSRHHYRPTILCCISHSRCNSPRVQHRIHTAPTLSCYPNKKDSPEPPRLSRKPSRLEGHVTGINLMLICFRSIAMR